MKHLVATLIFCTSFVIASAAGAATNTYDYIEGESSPSLVTPEAKAVVGAMLGEEKAAEFLHALQLQMAKYDLDMHSHDGRRSWHGRKIGESFHTADTNNAYKIEVYSNHLNGAVWRYRSPFKPVKPALTMRKVTMTTNGIPARLAAARLKRVSAINNGPIVTNITINATGGAVSAKAQP